MLKFSNFSSIKLTTLTSLMLLNLKSVIKKILFFPYRKVSRLTSLKILMLWGILLCVGSFVHYNFLLNEAHALEQSFSAAAKISTGYRLVNFIKTTVSTLRYTNYKLGGSRFEPSRGIYVVDCSQYVDHILHSVFPRAYAYLVNATGKSWPNSKDYYHFFMRLAAAPEGYWNLVRSARQLQPGDILVFCYKQTHRHAAGHIMIVMEKPTETAHNTVLVSVADAAPIGHSDDTRATHKSGIGIGKMLLKIDPNTGKPAAYAWKKN